MRGVLERVVLRIDRARLDGLLQNLHEAYGALADTKGLTMRLQRDTAVPDIVVGDPVRVRQILSNYLNNALKYTPTGGRVSIAVRAAPDAAVISIADNGPGIPPGEREAIFRRLYRVDSSRSQRGLGLGLSLVKAIVEAHGGKVLVAEAAGGGAQFDVRVPRV